jgi:hypothetical protein
MKIKLTATLAIATISFCGAQEKKKSPCEYVAVQTNVLEQKRVYSTYPFGFNQKDIGPINVIRVIDPKSDDTAIQIRITEYVANYQAKGVFVKFDTGEIIKLPDQAVECELNVYSGNFIYTGWVTLTKDNIMPFKTAKITSFSIGGYERVYKDKYAKLITPIIACISELK